MQLQLEQVNAPIHQSAIQLSLVNGAFSKENATSHQQQRVQNHQQWRHFLPYISNMIDIKGFTYSDVLNMKKPSSGPWFDIKMSSDQYRKYHYGDKTILWPSYLHNGISYTGKITSLYWIKAQVTRPLGEAAMWPQKLLLTHWGGDKWTPFRRRHFQMHFLEWKCMNFA